MMFCCIVVVVCFYTIYVWGGSQLLRGLSPVMFGNLFDDKQEFGVGAFFWKGSKVLLLYIVLCLNANYSIVRRLGYHE